jgi:hypothetical protein
MTSVIVPLHTTIVYALHSFAISEARSPCYVIASHGYHSLLRIDCIAWVGGMVDALEFCIAGGAFCIAGGAFCLFRDQTVTPSPHV